MIIITVYNTILYIHEGNCLRIVCWTSGDRYSTGLIVSRCDYTAQMRVIDSRRYRWNPIERRRKKCVNKKRVTAHASPSPYLYGIPTANGFFRFWNWFWIVFGALVHHGPDDIRVTDNNTRDDPRRRPLFEVADVLNDLPKCISNDRKRF